MSHSPSAPAELLVCTGCQYEVLALGQQTVPQMGVITDM